MVFIQFAKKLYHRIKKEQKRKYINELVKKGLTLGKNVNIVEKFYFDPSHCYLITIGDNCTICPGVRLIAHDASTKNLLGYTKLGKINIKENCFIGDSTIILPGVEIGPYAIVGAGSVVTKDVMPRTIVAGNPSKYLGKIDDYIKKIEKLAIDKKIFSEKYRINNLNEDKKNELIESVGSTIGFII